ncbi:hypothetical protein IEQ34_020111 [Dendrobium chrysotoxum]|uniref:Uncharacterized protein n=1 Tax=Dendrobium chrysotoxum TaxID=161865 RepID=A0AAV7G1J4_DENCH|nr:hypothetical protein IEQ34_020111 [Dendrobium chrysotoxum]
MVRPYQHSGGSVRNSEGNADGNGLRTGYGISRDPFVALLLNLRLFHPIRSLIHCFFSASQVAGFR